jgi:O-antigen/teichoic acid export membrane protein
MFCRMALTVGISLVITRLLLKYLGKVDFGLILALGATGTMLQFITGALTTGVQRQLSCEIARNDKEAISRVFSTSWVIYMALGAGLWLIGYALTPVIMRVLTIPPDRATAAWWVYQISLLNLVLVVTATPYQALLVSHQHLTVQAISDLFTVLTRLVAVLLLLVVPWDRMVAFVALQLAGYAVVRWSVNAYCLWRYEGCWPRPKNFDRTQLNLIFNVAVWSMLSNFSFRFRQQGGMLLLNIFFGPVVNAAYGIAIQVSSYAFSVSLAIRQTILPAIVGAYAKGNRQSVHRLALVAGKYTVLLTSLLFVPLWLEADQLLHFWLNDLPPDTLVLTRLVVIWTFTGLLVVGYMAANTATGKLGWYTRRTLASAVTTLVVSGVGFYFGLPPWFLPVAAIGSAISLSIAAVTGIGAEIELPPSRWIRESLVPTLCVLVPAATVAGAVHCSLPSGAMRIFVVAAMYAFVAVPLIWWVGLARWEREQFVEFVSSAARRLQRTLGRDPA